MEHTHTKRKRWEKVKLFGEKIKELEEQKEDLYCKLRDKELDLDLAIKKICTLEQAIKNLREEATKYKDLYLKQLDINIRIIEKGGEEE